jgi:hypothetical protein
MTSRSPSPEPLTHVQEQATLRKETISAFHTATTGNNDDEDDLLVPREKTKDEQDREEEEYRAFLEHEVGDLKDIIAIEPYEGEGEAEEGQKKKKKVQKVDGTISKRKSKEDKDQEFLMKYASLRLSFFHAPHSSLMYFPLVIFSTEVGLINLHPMSQHTKKSPLNTNPIPPKTTLTPSRTKTRTKQITPTPPLNPSMTSSKPPTTFVLKNPTAQQ